jgi:hypothetical protein
MAITTKNKGFTEANLKTSDGARLYASLVCGAFGVSTLENNGQWYFSEKCCREAAEFFNQLADELDRINVEDEDEDREDWS